MRPARRPGAFRWSAVAADDYPPIADHALIADSRAAALVSRSGSIDWACVPRFDSAACFARLLDRERGGFCAVEPSFESTLPPSRAYLDDTLVLVTTFNGPGGHLRLIDFLALADGEMGEEAAGRRPPELVRILEGAKGTFDLSICIAPRFDYGAVDPWMRRLRPQTFAAIGGDDALVVWSDAELEVVHRHRLEGQVTVGPGDRVRLSMSAVSPADVDGGELPDPGGPDGVDERLERTASAWRKWASRLDVEGADAPAAKRSAIVLQALTYAPTGAVVAAPTTSLPEGRGSRGSRNWDYRYSWIRDSALAVRSMARLGCEEEARDLRRFVERSAAGNAKDLQIMFGVGGERRLVELELDHLEGYRGAGPVRIGNGAAEQLQLDAYGQLLDQSWRWYERGHEPDDDYWRFLVDLVEAAIERWTEPDAGIWEWRDEPRHFVHSKVMCWAAVDRGLLLAERCMRKAPERRWNRARHEIRDEIERRGYDSDRGVFVQAFDSDDLDAAVLRLPSVDFVAPGDERMVRTVDAIREELDLDGLLRRYTVDDGNGAQEEGAFVACSFWLVECLASQGRDDEARAAYDRAQATANELGLMAEEYDPESREMLGNFPQALSHLSHLEAVLALASGGDGRDRGTAPAG
jgi:GH15 family glucan-1,4-alpha-glucosidase